MPFVANPEAMSDATEPRIVLNAIETPDGTVLVSRHRHDYREHTDANGSTYAVDGGSDYLKRSGPRNYAELSIYLEGGVLRRTAAAKDAALKAAALDLISHWHSSQQWKWGEHTGDLIKRLADAAGIDLSEL